LSFRTITRHGSSSPPAEPESGRFRVGVEVSALTSRRESSALRAESVTNEPPLLTSYASVGIVETEITGGL
jgi:hypothetical protein